MCGVQVLQLARSVPYHSHLVGMQVGRPERTAPSSGHACWGTHFTMRACAKTRHEYLGKRLKCAWHEEGITVSTGQAVLTTLKRSRRIKHGAFVAAYSHLSLDTSRRLKKSHDARAEAQQILVAAARPNDAQAQWTAIHRGDREAHLQAAKCFRDFFVLIESRSALRELLTSTCCVDNFPQPCTKTAACLLHQQCCSAARQI